MSEVQYTQSLNRIIEYAKTFDEKKEAPFTAERFIVALFDAVEMIYDLGDSSETDTIKAILDDAGLDPEMSKKLLLQYISSGASTQHLDDFFMRERLEKAEETAKNDSCDVSVELLLKILLEDPSLAIKSCIRASGKKPVPVAPKPAPAPTPTPEPTPTPTSTPAPVDTFSEDDEEDEDTDDTIDIEARHRIVELTQMVKKIQNELLGKVIGQDNAVSVFCQGFFRAELLSLTDKERRRPKATFLFAGPPGVGKTFLAENISEVLRLPFKCFDMSEYCEKEASMEFCGSDKVYKNGKPGNFTSFVTEHPKSVVLFDEIEKAHLSIIHLFLQMLDAGRIRDNYTDEEIPLKDVIMIFTTNAGKQLYDDYESEDLSSISRKVILKALQNDINPVTGVPFFPAAICSRFASGNVVMFNKIGAQGLRNIAKREVLRHAENYEREFGVKTEFDERVFTSLLFAEGGSADARTVRSRAETFFDNELFELFRLVASDPELKAVNKIDRIKFAVELPDPSNPVYSMFETVGRPEVLVFSSDETAALCRKKVNGCLFARVNNPQDADAYLRRHDVKLVLIDLTVGMRVDEGYLNIEDADSEARDFFHHIREKHTALPVYILETSAHTFSSEEKVSFTRQGVRGFLPLSETEDSFFEEFEEIRVKLHHQESMTELAKASKIVTFETSQILSAKGRTAQIKLFDFSLGVAMDAEDSKNIVSGASKPNVRFEDILGADDAKRELEYFVEYLKNPKRYIGTGVRAPKGVLLYGPPGTGKTLLAKAMASKSDVTFICAEGNQFLKRFVGEGPEKVHELFKTARKYAPSILFVDEIDAIAKERSGGADGKGSEETLTAFLTEMDGFRNDTAKPVFVLAATNFNPEPGTDKSLDSALMRRFDRKIYVDLPKRDDRVKYIKLKISKNSAFEISEDKINNLAVRSTGMSLAVLESVLELSLRTVIREGKMKVTDAILEEAFETFNSGEKKTWNADTLERVARHEAGHALVCRHGGDMPSYITVVSRGNHGGYMQHGDNEDKPIYTKEELLSKIRTSLGGRAAEMVCYGNELGISTGASGDLGNATRIAELYLTTYGMDTNFGLSTSKPDSSELRAAVNKILAEQLEKTVEIIERNRDVLDKLTKALVDKNHLAGDEIKAIFANPLV